MFSTQSSNNKWLTTAHYGGLNTFANIRFRTCGQLENGYSIKGIASSMIKSGDLLLWANNYWCRLHLRGRNGASVAVVFALLLQSNKSHRLLTAESSSQEVF